VTYFDHVRCSACKAMIDPESLGSRPGQGLSCPRCGAPLSLGDLFGLKDAFAEEDQEELSLDDAMSKMRAPTASVAPPTPAPRSAPRPAPGARPAPRAPAAPAPAGRPAAKQLPGPGAPAVPARPAAPAARPPAGKPLPAASPAAPADDGGGALDAMKALRKKK
jgi:hypothetical protein